MGTEISKQFLEYNGKPILCYTIEKFQNCNLIDEIIVVTSDENVNFCKKEIIEKHKLHKVTSIVVGGSERQHSVYKGLMACNPKTEIVLVHDGVRPFIRSEDIIKTINGAKEFHACILAVKVKDTIKVGTDHHFVLNTPNRECLWSIQTPQSFQYGIIRRAYEYAFKNNFLGTDDSMLVEQIGVKIKIIEGSFSNIKITTKEDLIYLDAFLGLTNEYGSI